METSRKKQERRRFRRLPAAELHAAWRPRKTLFGGYRPAQSYDFNRDGLSITERVDSFQVGDRVELKLQLTMKASSISLERLVAEVVNQRPLEGETNVARFGLAFDFTGSRPMRTQQLRAQLGRIEGILERSEKRRLRRQPLETITALAEHV